MTEDRLVFWGTGDAMGVPRVYCGCEVCEEARAEGVNRRMRSMVAVESGKEQDRFLIDCGPDWRMQMEMRGIRTIDTILVTHAHFDHIGGLPEWADQCRWTGIRGNLYAPGEVLEAIRARYPWLDRNLELRETEPGLRLGGWSIAGWRVNHGQNGYSYAYRLEKENFAWVYCPDSIGLSEEETRPMRNADLLVLGTSFVREEAEYSTRSVYDMREAAELLAEIKPARAIYTHMSHDVDLNRLPDLPANVSAARTGTAVDLNDPARNRNRKLGGMHDER
ncbi:MBL fold metallo-hydrolase [Saccharibacillus alkalitolerans]|uniref:MBL fold metallo-hydrolase n=1 Tax=Saccharibacillus alkalitolerans TaxID=2705290 RepID=A0ABX0FCU6_9BACL|nr:MBL fold metallo-hydrolase [Saccharibacillus alkalitolerans]NGZ75972.1 MBL fold metallo-hydrolase [Saccharibacillus alkalitolerans]